MRGKTVGAFVIVIIGFIALGLAYAAVWTSANDLSSKFGLSALVTVVLFVLNVIGWAIIWAIMHIEDVPEQK